MRCIILIISLLISFNLFSQEAKKYEVAKSFSPASPIDHKIRLSGTFGELRTNHFHMGIDLKSTNGRSGDPIYSVAEGRISRIKIEAGGYGQAIYIDHPEGYTTVYGHLDKLSNDLTSVVRDSQYRYESFEVDLNFSETDTSEVLYVQRGEKIGEMGTKGYSFGPHLHFEIRNTKTETAINPLIFDFELTDRISPRPRKLVINSLNSSCDIIESSQHSLIPLGNNRYTVSGRKIKVHSKSISPSVYVRDQMNNTPNNNGIYGMKVYLNNNLKYSFSMDSVKFRNTRYMNAHIDYNYYKETSIKTHRTSFLSNCNSEYPATFDNLSIYDKNSSTNTLEITGDTTNYMKIECLDIYGNKSTIEFGIELSDQKNEDATVVYNYFLPSAEASRINLNEYSLYFPKNSLYQNLKLNLTMSGSIDSDCLNKSLFLHDDNTPLHSDIEISVDLNDVIDTKSIFLAKCEKNNNVYHMGNSIHDDQLIAYTREFGNFCLMRDTLAPEIKVLRAYKSPVNSNSFKFKVTDNITGGLMSSKNIKVTLDGEFVYHELSAKSNHVYFYLSEIEKQNRERELEISVKDLENNYNRYKTTFYY